MVRESLISILREKNPDSNFSENGAAMYLTGPALLTLIISAQTDGGPGSLGGGGDEETEKQTDKGYILSCHVSSLSVDMEDEGSVSITHILMNQSNTGFFPQAPVAQVNATFRQSGGQLPLSGLTECALRQCF